MAKNVYTTKEVADNLGITTSTVRKYCLMLEDERIGNYKIQRNAKDQRLFYDYDVMAFRQLQQLTQEDGITLENAVKTIGDKLRSRQEDVVDDETTTAISDVLKQHEEKLDEMMEYMKRQEERIEQQDRFNRELLSKLDEQNRYIVESIKERDQQLLFAIRETQETKRLIAAAEEAKPEPKKGFFARLFGK
jgi:DNA-binding transcriptional MerR regulator